MSEARTVAEKMLGKEEAFHLVEGRQTALMNNLPPSQVQALPAGKTSGGLLRRLFGRGH